MEKKRSEWVGDKVNKNKEADKALLNILQKSNNEVIIDNLNALKKN